MFCFAFHISPLTSCVYLDMSLNGPRPPPLKMREELGRFLLILRCYYLVPLTHTYIHTRRIPESLDEWSFSLGIQQHCYSLNWLPNSDFRTPETLIQWIWLKLKNLYFLNTQFVRPLCKLAKSPRLGAQGRPKPTLRPLLNGVSSLARLSSSALYLTILAYHHMVDRWGEKHYK